MGHVSSNSTLYLPGLQNIFPAEQAFVERRFPEVTGLQSGVFLHNGLHTYYYVSKASSEKAVVAGITGIHTQSVLHKDQIKELNDAGITFIWMALPILVKGKKFMQDAEDLTRAFLTSHQSPLHALRTMDIPCYVATHSTGGAILLKLLHEENTRRRLAATFSGAAYVAPFLDVPFASRDHSLNIRGIRPFYSLFEHFSARNSESAVNTLRSVKAYLALTARHENFMGKPADLSPTFGQIREIQAYSRAMIDGFRPEHAGALNSVVMAGKKDRFTCYKTTRAIAESMGADFYLAACAGHDPLKDRPELVKVFIDKVTECTLKFRESRATELVAWHTPAFETIPLPPYREPLGHRARVALQSSARLLNATASFF